MTQWKFHKQYSSSFVLVTTPTTTASISARTNRRIHNNIRGLGDALEHAVTPLINNTTIRTRRNQRPCTNVPTDRRPPPKSSPEPRRSPNRRSEETLVPLCIGPFLEHLHFGLKPLRESHTQRSENAGNNPSSRTTPTKGLVDAFFLRLSTWGRKTHCLSHAHFPQ